MYCGSQKSELRPPTPALKHPTHTTRSRKVNRIPGLSGNGHMAFAVNTSWTSPCHWQFALQADEVTSFLR